MTSPDAANSPVTAETNAGSVWYRAELDANEAGPSNDEWKLTSNTIDRTQGGSEQGEIWVPPAQSNPQYDLDGNLENDGRWVYGWNEENRLKSMTTTPEAEAELGYSIELKFAYDWLGRRISKNVGYTGAGAPPDTSTRYLYDGWNLLGEFSESGGSLTLERSYTWGLDLSGSMQGAGGVGGLLSATIHDGTDSYPAFPAYDGNGNIIAWNAADPSDLPNQQDTILRHLDYDAFGNVHVQRETKYTGGSVFDEGFPFGFSTKYLDAETNLYYYGFRYYNPSTGRWISRDPIEEEGGVNIYGFVGNNAVGGLDYLGLQTSYIDGILYEQQLERHRQQQRGNVDRIEEKFRRIVAYSREAGWNVAADNLEHFLGASGKPRQLDWKWLRGIQPVTDAEKQNKEGRILGKTLWKKLNRFRGDLPITSADNHVFLDWWVSWWEAEKAKDTELYYASGGASLTSFGEFEATCLDSQRFRVTANVDHYFWDGYDWHTGLGVHLPKIGWVPDSDAIALKKAGKAEPFWMDSIWTQTLEVTYDVEENRYYDVKWGAVKGGGSGAATAVLNRNPGAYPKLIKDGEYKKSDMTLK